MHQNGFLSILMRRVAVFSPAYAGSHGCQAVEECERVSSEASAKEDMLRRVPPKTTKGPRPKSRGAPLVHFSSLSSIVVS